MISQPVILFFINLKNLMMVSFLGAHNGIGVIMVFHPHTQNSKKIFVMHYVLRVDDIEIAFAKRQVVYGIKQVGFAYAVIPRKTIDPL